MKKTNSYIYALNTPLNFQDPNGESVWGFMLGLGEIVLGGMLVISGGILEMATFGSYTIGCGVQVGAGRAIIRDGLVRTTSYALSYTKSTINWGVSE